MKKLFVFVMIGAVSILFIGSVIAKLVPASSSRISSGAAPISQVATSIGKLWLKINPGGLGNNTCSSLVLDRLGNMYAGNPSGVYRKGVNDDDWQQIDNQGSRLLCYDKMKSVLYSATDNPMTVRKWNGSDWKQVGTPLSGGSGSIYTMTTDLWGNLYVGGGFKFYPPNSTTYSRVVKMNWNGSSWIGLGDDGLVGMNCYSLLVGGGTVTAAGDNGKPEESGVWVRSMSTLSGKVGRDAWTYLGGIGPTRLIFQGPNSKIYAIHDLTHEIYVLTSVPDPTSPSGAKLVFQKLPFKLSYGPIDGSADIKAIAFDSANNFYIAGQFQKFTGGNTTIKYTVLKLNAATNTFSPVEGQSSNDNLLGFCTSLTSRAGYLYAAGDFGQVKDAQNRSLIVNVVSKKIQ